MSPAAAATCRPLLPRRPRRAARPQEQPRGPSHAAPAAAAGATDGWAQQELQRTCGAPAEAAREAGAAPAPAAAAGVRPRRRHPAWCRLGRRSATSAAEAGGYCGNRSAGAARLLRKRSGHSGPLPATPQPAQQQHRRQRRLRAAMLCARHTHNVRGPTAALVSRGGGLVERAPAGFAPSLLHEACLHGRLAANWNCNVAKQQPPSCRRRAPLPDPAVLPAGNRPAILARAHPGTCRQRWTASCWRACLQRTRRSFALPAASWPSFEMCLPVRHPGESLQIWGLRHVQYVIAAWHGCQWQQESNSLCTYLPRFHFCSLSAAPLVQPLPKTLPVGHLILKKRLV